METGDLPPPDLENAGGWYRYLWRWLRGLLPRKSANSAGDGAARRMSASCRGDSEDGSPRQNIYNFSGNFFGSITIYEEGDNEPTVEIRPNAGTDAEDDSDE